MNGRDFSGRRRAGMAEAGPAGSESELVLRVKMIDGREIQVDVPRAGRIADVAEKVLEAEDAPMHKMIRLIYGGRLMQPEDPIAVYNIGPQVVIHAGERRKQPLDPALGLRCVGCTRRCAPASAARGERHRLHADTHPNTPPPVISDAPFHVASSGATHGDAVHGSRPSAGADEPPRRPSPAAHWGATSVGAQAGNDVEGLLLKLPPGFLLMLMWYVYLVYGTDLFSWFSTLSLVILTTLYLCYALPGYAQGPVSFLDHALSGLFHYMNPPPPGSHRPHRDVSPTQKE